MPPGWRRLVFSLMAMLLGLVPSLGIAFLLVHLDLVELAVYKQWRQRREMQREVERIRNMPVRIMVLGDSCLKRWSPYSSLDLLLMEYCRENGAGYLNLARSGIGPRQYHRRLKDHIGDYRPDLVLLFYFVENDTLDLSTPAEIMSHEGPAGKPACRCADGVIIEDRINLDRLRGCGVPEDLVEKAREWTGLGRKYGDNVINPHLLCMGMDAKYYLRVGLLMDNPAVMEAFKRVKEEMQKISRMTRQAGAELFLVFIPSVVQVSHSHDSFFKKAGFLWDDRLSASTRPQELLRELARELRIPCLDLLPHFRAHPRKEELYWNLDNHPSELGYSLTMKLVRRKFLDAWMKRHHPTGRQISPPR